MTEKSIKQTKNKEKIKIDIEKLPCKKCEWRWSMHCPKCEWNKNGDFCVY